MAARSRARGLDRARRCLGQDRTAVRRPRCRAGQARAMRGGHLEAIEALPSTSRARPPSSRARAWRRRRSPVFVVCSGWVLGRCTTAL